MGLVNRVTGGLLDVLLWPFRGLPPAVGLAFVSLLTAVGVLLVYRAVSDQEGITAVRRAILAALLEMRLFRDDLVVVFRAQGRVGRQSLRYFRYSLKPLAWLIVPLTLAFVQLQHRYGYRPLGGGERAVVKVTLGSSFDPVSLGDVALEGDSGVAVETPALRIPALGELNWRIAALSPGRHAVTVRIGERRVTKTVVVGETHHRFSPVRPSRNLLDQLIRPAEPAVPAGVPIRSISVGYAAASVSVFGWRWNWVVAFLVFTIGFGLVLQKPLGVKL